jgi:Dolichyl-phosphate-mannose-protein mannosyltransferase
MIVGARVPLTEDEAYYWQWSEHLAAGYIDHPPAVAWLIAAFAPLGSPAFIRLDFVICGIVAGLALADAARIVARKHGVDPKPAMFAAVCAFSFAPVTWFSFGTAMPDGPYLACWCVAVWAAARAVVAERRSDMILLGFALGGALLSRAFGLALLAGIIVWSLLPAQRHLWRRGLWLAFAVAGLMYAPFLVWNGNHDWVNFAFSVQQRNEVHAPALAGLWHLAYGAMLMYSPGFWLAAVCTLAGILFFMKPPFREPLIAWTAAPLAAVLTVLALFETVEQHWYLGPYASLCVGMGLWYARWQPHLRRVWVKFALVPAMLLLGVGMTAAAAPGRTYAALHAVTHLTLRNDGPFEIYAYRGLARDVAKLTERNAAGVMTTSYGLAAELDYHRRLHPVVIGDDYRGRESRRWPLIQDRNKMIDVERTPLSANSSLQQLLVRSCRQVVSGPVLRYRFADAPWRRFYTTYCIGIDQKEVAALRTIPPAQ